MLLTVQSSVSVISPLYSLTVTLDVTSVFGLDSQACLHHDSSGSLHVTDTPPVEMPPEMLRKMKAEQAL